MWRHSKLLITTFIMLSFHQDVIFGPKMGQIDTKWDKSGTLWRSIFSLSRNILINDLQKSPIFVPFCANLAHFGPKTENPALYSCIWQTTFSTGLLSVIVIYLGRSTSLPSLSEIQIFQKMNFYFSGAINIIRFVI